MKNLTAVHISSSNKPVIGDLSEYKIYDEDELVISVSRRNHRTKKPEERVIFVKIGNGGLPSQMHQELFNNCKILGKTLKPRSKRRNAQGLYFGAWRRLRKKPAWTADSHRHDRKKGNVDEFLGNCSHVFKYMCGVVKRRFPKIYDRYVNTQLDLEDFDDFEKRPFAPYMTMGVNVNNAVSMHKDWAGEMDGMECVAVVGDWKVGGDLVLEDVKTIVKLRPGDIYLLNSANIYHHVTNFNEGSRYSVVLFTDKAMIKM
jgi:hypothetical protein